MAAETEMTKSARKRANKKARDAAFAEAEAAQAPAQVSQANKENKPKQEAAPKTAAAPKAKAAAAKAEPVKAEPKAQGKAQPKAKADAAAKAPAAKAAAAPAAAAPKAKAQADAKAGAKAKAKPVKQAEPPAPQLPAEEITGNGFVFLDDGKGGAWEVNNAADKKKQRQADKKKKEEAEKEAAPAPATPQQKYQAPKQDRNQAPKQEYKVPASVHAEIARILESKLPAPDEKAAADKSNDIIETVMVPDDKIKVVIGTGGQKIKMIQEKCKVSRIDTVGEIFTITGPKEAVEEAKKAIIELKDKGYTSLSYDDFAEGIVSVSKEYFPTIIGVKGATIRKIKDQLGVEVVLPKDSKSDPPGKKHKVLLAGEADKVETAKKCINDLVMYYHSEITHPGQIHAEMEVEGFQYRLIIGAQGSELKHIENNYKVRVNIPRDHTVNQKVVIVGEEAAVERARAYIEKKLSDAETANKKRDDADAHDPRDEDDDVDPQAKRYMK